MNFLGNLTISIYSIVILVMIYFQLKKQEAKESLAYRIYMMMIKLTAALLIMDILSRINSKAGTFISLLSHVGDFMLFFFNLAIPSLWLLYVYIQVLQEDSRMRRLRTSLIMLNVLNAVVVILSQFRGWLYYYDLENNYQRGPIFAIPVIIAIVLLLSTYILILKNKNYIDKKQGFTLAFFAIFPFAGIILQVLFYGMSLMLNSIVLSLLLVFLNIQNNNLYTDYLTGASNRKRLDIYLKEKIKMSIEGKPFSAIMLDLNYFKHINDTFGHDVGDCALKDATKLLKSCLRADDFIARFGGDEFCIVLDLSKQTELEEVVQRINQCFVQYNETSNKPYDLFFSMGYAVYDRHLYVKMEDFLKHLDLLMYESKQNKK